MKNLENITNFEAIEVAELLGSSSHLSDDSKIHQVKELLERRWNMQTNIPGIRWYRVWKYLEAQGYQIDIN